MTGRGAGELEVRLLGAVGASVDGTPLDLGGRQTRVLLAALALSPGSAVSTDHVMEALWGDDPPASATGTLQAIVSRLRTAVGKAGLVERVGDGYRLAVAPEQVDAARFEQLLAAARQAPDDTTAADRYGAALAQWSGPALVDAAADALQPAATRLDALRLVALEEEADVGLRLARHAALVPHLERLVADHPLHERFTALLMTALYRSGRQADALRAFTRTRGVLADELGLQPSPDLLALEAAVLRQDPELDAPSEPLATGGPVAVSLPFPADAATRRLAPLVGRGAELDSLWQRWQEAVAGRAGVVALSGDPGIGKTRLAVELAERAHGEGAIVLWGACTHPALGTSRPLPDAVGPLADALSTWSVAQEVAACCRPAAGLPANVDRDTFVMAIVELIGAVAASTPVLVVFDDVQWADTTLTAVGTRVIREHPDASLLVVTTLRRSELPRDHPVAEAFAGLRRTGHLDDVALHDLPLEAVAELVQHLTPEAADRAGDLHARTRGNPFFVEELAMAGAAPSTPLPVTVLDAIEGRVARLGYPARQVLAAAAIIGPEFPVDVVGRMVDLDRGPLTDALDEILASHLATEESTAGLLAFAHALVRESLLVSMTGVRRRQLHAAAADAVEARGGSAVLVAQHLLEAGSADPAVVVGWLQRGADEAKADFAYAQGLGLLAAALDLLDPGDHATRADLLRRRGELFLADGDLPRARQALLDSALEGRAAGDPSLVTAAAAAFGHGFSGGLTMNAGPVDTEVLCLLDDAVAAATDPALELQLLGTTMGLLFLYNEDPERRDAIMDRSLELGHQLGDDRSLALAHNTVKNSQWWAGGDLELQLASAEAAIAHADRAGDPTLQALTRIEAGPTFYEAGRLDQLAAEMDVFDRIALPWRQDRPAWFSDATRSGLPLWYGDADAAEQHLERAYARTEAVGEVALLVYQMGRMLLGRLRGMDDATATLCAGISEQMADVAAAQSAAGLALGLAGRNDEARAVLAPLAARGIASARRDSPWRAALCWYAEASVLLGEEAWIRDAGDALTNTRLRTAGLPGHGLGGLRCGIGGLLDRAMGLVARAEGDHAAARQHLTTALELATQLRGTPAIAQLEADLQDL